MHQHKVKQGTSGCVELTAEVAFLGNPTRQPGFWCSMCRGRVSVAEALGHSPREFTGLVTRRENPAEMTDFTESDISLIIVTEPPRHSRSRVRHGTQPV
jgi:hypothetical protein